MSERPVMSAPCAGGVLADTSARARLIVAFALVVLIAAVRTFEGHLLALAGALAITLFAGCSARRIARRLLHVEGFLLVLMVVLPITVAGKPLATLGPLTLTAEGLAKAASIALKVNAAALVLLALVASLDSVRLGRGLAGLGMPSPLTSLLLMTTRYVALFCAEAARLQDAMRARGFVARSSLHTWRTLGNLAGLMLVRALDRAERVEEAMRARGGSRLLAAKGDAEPFNSHDAALAAAALAFAAIVLGGSWTV